MKYLKAVIITTLLLITTATFAQTTAEEILNTVLDSQRGGQTTSMTMTMTVVRPEKDDKIFSIESVGDGDAKSLIRVLEPVREKDTAFLQDGDNLYLFNPRLKRTLRLPPSGQSDSFLGSDVSYSDLGGRELETEYSAEVTSEDDTTVELTLIPDALAATPYGKVVLIADKENNFRPVEYLYFDQRETAIRKLTFDEYIETAAEDDADSESSGEPIYMPTLIEIINLIDEGEKTVIQMDDVKFGVDVSQDCFKQSALERGCD